MAEATQETALLTDTYGVPLLAYLCGAEENVIRRRMGGEGFLQDRQEAVLADLLALALVAAGRAADNEAPLQMELSVLAQLDQEAGTSLGNVLRLKAGGTIDLPVPDDDVLKPLVLLLRDAYPLMLVPRDEWFQFSFPHLTTYIWNSPHRQTCETAVLADPDLSRLFVEETESGGWTGMVYRSTGSGGTVQLWSLPDLLLTAAWWFGRLEARIPSPSDLVAVLADQVELLRRAVRGETREVKALVAFTGVVFDGVDAIEVPFGTLRPTTDRERQFAPPALEGHVSHTTSEGDSVTASYAGDVVLETSLPYRLTVERPSDEDLDWPTGLADYETLDSHIDTLRLSLLLASDADIPVVLVPTWRLILDPLSWGPSLSWSDPRTGRSVAPRRLTPTDAADWKQWVDLVHERRWSGLDVAIRRTLSAATKRQDPVDALVDFVIAWENLFGSRQGESTLRVSSALAWLLAERREEREEVRATATRIYSVRSEIVHGNRVVPGEEATAAVSDARRITLSGLQKLFRERSDILALRNGDARSRTLIIGG